MVQMAFRNLKVVMLGTMAMILSVSALDIASDVPEKEYNVRSQGVPPPPPFRFASSQSNNMVLQMSPLQATVWGFCPEGTSVEVKFNNQLIQATTSTWLNESTWIAQLPATKGSITASGAVQTYNITATSGGQTIILTDVLFGDVWVCSGQSNMQYPLGAPDCWNASNINCTIKDAQCGYGCVQNSGEEIAAMSNYTHMRVYQNANSGSQVPLPESQNTGWVLPSDIGGKFSAMCWFFGRDLYDAMKIANKVRAIGLIETNVGGTPDQHWSSPDAIAQCENKGKPWDWPAGYKDSVLWNGKVVPLLRNTIQGAIWMQGEANSRADGRQYNCSFQAMIKDWRAKWAEGTGKATSPEFPFGWAQLNSDGAATARPYQPVANSSGFEDPIGEWSAGFPSIRWAEQNALALPNTFQAVILDTPVASGSVHSPFKQPAGSRLARRALEVAYDTPQPNPVVAKVTRSGESVAVTLSGLSSGTLEIRGQNSGFEYLKGNMWILAKNMTVQGDTITLDNVPESAKALRYLWYAAPCGNMEPFQCPVYLNGLSPLGSLSGERNELPLGPFITLLE